MSTGALASLGERDKWNRYYATLPLVDPDNTTRLFNRQLVDLVAEILPPASHILEAGCGGGWHSLALAQAGHHVSLLDFSDQALSYARSVFERAGVSANFDLADFEKAGTPVYDLVFNAGVLEHYTVARQAALLRGMASRSRRFVLALVPNRNCYWYWLWRLRLSADGQWEWGKEVPESDLGDAFASAGIHLIGHRYVGEAWTEHFIRTVIHDPAEQAAIEAIHRSDVIGAAQRAYLIAALGTVEASPVRIPGWTNAQPEEHRFAELQAALADAIAVQVRSTRDHAATESALASAQSDLASARRRIDTLRECQLREAAIAAELSELRTHHETLVALIQEGERSHRIVAADRDRLTEALEQESKKASAAAEALQRQGAEIRDLREQLDAAQRTHLQAETLRRRAFAAWQAMSAEFQTRLAEYRGQRAWRIMLAVRETYASLMRGGLGEKLRLATLPFRWLSPGHDWSRHELHFPDPWQYAPPELSRPITAASVPATPATLTDRCLDIVVFPIFDFEFRFQRPQQIATRLAATGHRVYWISPGRRAKSGVDLTPIRENLWEVRLPGGAIDMYGGHLEGPTLESMRSGLAELYRRESISESCAYLQFPFWTPLGLDARKHFGARVLYDLMDDWRNWPTEPLIGKDNLDAEELLLRKADILLVTAREFFERHRDNQPPPLLVPNAADFDFFREAQPSGRLAKLRKPVIGYYGAISSWFDVDLVAGAAARRPDYSFVLIGQVHAIDPAPLRALSNISLLGEKSYRELPALLAEFDVCLIPFRVNTLTRGVDPVKLYEYFSQGKPVVATPIPELLPHRDLLSLAATAEEFVEAIDDAVRMRDQDTTRRRIEFAKANSWAARADRIDQAIAQTYPLVSLLVVTHNSREFMAPFLDSVRRNTTWPNYEVVLVDNQSSDGTADLLEQYAAKDARLRVIAAGKNLGFAGGNNLAAKNARGDWLVFINPDIVVTHGWLGRLLTPHQHAAGIGLTAPVTNHSGNETKIDFDYTDLAGMEAFAAKIAAGHRGELRDVEVAPLLCGAVSRKLWDQLGELDERFEVGMFEDDDFSLRVRQAGLRIVAVEDCFLHHFGHGSFAQVDPDRSRRIFEENRRRFEQKWSLTWREHTLRPGVRPLREERRFTVEEFIRAQPDGSNAIDWKPILKALHPDRARAGVAFNRQPNGSAALAIDCQRATPSTLIRFGDTLLPTAFGNANLLTAALPSNLYKKRGVVEVALVNDHGESEPLLFTVE